MSEEKDRVDGTADETKAETKSSDHHTEDTYEKVCFMCRRPESKAGKMITLPGNINICPDCMQKSFDAMSNGPIDYSQLMNIPGVQVFNMADPEPAAGKEKRRKEENKRIFHQGHSAAAPDQGDA